MLAWGRFVARHPRSVLVATLALLAAATVYGLGVFGSLDSSGGFTDPSSESARADEMQFAHFAGAEADVVVVYSSETMTVSDPRFRSAVTDTLEALPDRLTTRVITGYTVPDAGLVSADGHATQVVVTLAGADRSGKQAAFEQLQPLLSAPGVRTDVAGLWAVSADVEASVGADIARAEALSMPVVFLLSLVIFGSAVAALLPTLVGGAAVFGAFALVRGLTALTDVSVFAINVITLLGMGLAIDYALFVVSRFREELDGRSDRDAVAAAVARTMATAGRTVLFSGLLVAGSLASLVPFPQGFLRSMGLGGMAAVLVAMAAAMTLLPAVLALLGHRIDAGRLRVRTRRRPAASGRWVRLAESVMSRPVRYLVVLLAGLALLGSPFLGVRWGSVDYRVLPADAPSRIAAETQARFFGGDTASADVVVLGGDRAALADYTAAVAALPGMRSVTPVAEREVEGVSTTLVRATWAGESQSEASQEQVSRLRAVPLPPGATSLVGGSSARTVDLIDSIRAHLPRMALLVASVMLALLFLAFGSLVLPLKAIAVNAVSIVASFGVVTWIFQDGHLSGLLGFDPMGYLDVTQPILMLAILFGLSMDYEVFLLSRIREEWDRTGDNRSAVARGLERTGRIITSAAVLLAVVVAGFATSGIVFVKMIGVGMLVALLLDATVVRGMLVPATMRLLGDANWWAPAPMLRWWQRHGAREAPAPEAEPPAEPVSPGAARRR